MYLGDIDVNIDIVDVLDRIGLRKIKNYLANQNIETSEPLNMPNLDIDDKEVVQFLFDYLYKKKYKTVVTDKERMKKLVSDMIDDNFYFIKRFK